MKTILIRRCLRGIWPNSLSCKKRRRQCSLRLRKMIQWLDSRLGVERMSNSENSSIRSKLRLVLSQSMRRNFMLKSRSSTGSTPPATCSYPRVSSCQSELGTLRSSRWITRRALSLLPSNLKSWRTSRIILYTRESSGRWTRQGVALTLSQANAASWRALQADICRSHRNKRLMSAMLSEASLPRQRLKRFLRPLKDQRLTLLMKLDTLDSGLKTVSSSQLLIQRALSLVRIHMSVSKRLLSRSTSHPLICATCTWS